VRALLTTLFASRGSILLTAGDEFGRTQQGNNNAYAQDNAIGWLDWSNRDQALEDFVAGLAAFRATHPRLRDQAFLRDADWRDLDGTAMTTQKWEDPQCPGFELRLPADHGETLRLRFDRRARIARLACEP
jgi:glycogen operon protein